MKEGRRQQAETRTENTNRNVWSETANCMIILYLPTPWGLIALPREVWTLQFSLTDSTLSATGERIDDWPYLSTSARSHSYIGKLSIFLNTVFLFHRIDYMWWYKNSQRTNLQDTEHIINRIITCLKWVLKF